jgi:hypothetical protein
MWQSFHVFLAALIGGLILTGCGGPPEVLSTRPIGDVADTPHDGIRVYRVKLPDCPFEEIGEVLVAKGTEEELLDLAKGEAGRLGGHAIAGLDYRTKVVAADWANELMLRAVVLRFTDPQCQK